MQKQVAVTGLTEKEGDNHDTINTITINNNNNNEEWCLLVCYAVWILLEPTFRRNLAPPSSG
jgi:hypothetical protein